MAYDIFCIDADYLRPRLACSYLILHHGKAAFIDCGTNHSVPRLLETLASCGLSTDAVDYIIPTHIHLDHAGGAGVLMQQCKNAKLIVHPKGVRHLSDPNRLIESVKEVYGVEKYNALYGEIIPIDENRIIPAIHDSTIDLNGRPLIIADTPGHARHHICLYDIFSNGWFTGDTFGISYPDIEIPSGNYLFPTTTPVQFEPEAWVTSLDILLQKNPDKMYLTHFNTVENVFELASKLKSDLIHYVELAKSFADSKNRVETLIRELYKYTLSDLRAIGNIQDDDKLRELLTTDMTLNAQGLDVWLSRTS